MYTADTTPIDSLGSDLDSQSDIDSPVKKFIFKSNIQPSGKAVNLRITPTKKDASVKSDEKGKEIPLSPQKLMTMFLSKKSGLQYKSPAKLLSKKKVSNKATVVVKDMKDTQLNEKNSSAKKTGSNKTKNGDKSSETTKETKGRQSVTFGNGANLSNLGRKRVSDMNSQLASNGKIVKKRKLGDKKSLGLNLESGQEWSEKEEERSLQCNEVVYRGFLAEVYHLVADRVMSAFA